MRIGSKGVAALALSVALAATTAAGAATQDAEPDDRGEWELIGELDLARRGHTATLLPDERILVVGGTSASDRPVLTAEIVYPLSGATRPAGTLPWGLAGHQAVALDDGRVLFSGSDSYDGGEATADQDMCAEYPPLLWDPDTLTFRPIPGLADSNGTSASVLADGRVLFAGGETACIWHQALVGLDGARIWDPTSGAVTVTGSLTTPRAFGPALTLPDGRVLMGGGTRLIALPEGATMQRSGSLEAWDPDTGEWTTFGRAGVSLDALTALDDRLVALTGTFDDGYGVRIFDTEAGTLQAPSSADPKPLREAAIATVDGGRVTFVGGLNESARPVPTSLVWEPANGDRTRIRYPRTGADSGHTATALSNGTIIVIGGQDDHGGGRVLATVEALGPER